MDKSFENSIENHDFFTQIANAIFRRYHKNAGKSLRDVYRQDADFLDVGTDAEFAARNRKKILDVLEDGDKFEQLVDLFVKMTIEFTYASNQFIQIDDGEDAELRRIYMDYLHQIRGVLAENRSEAAIAAGLKILVKEHFQDLQVNIQRFFDREVTENPNANVILQKVACAEYDPELQLEILGIQLGELVPPVLDLGCGKSGRLVEYLNRQGIQAIGVDRLVDALPSLIQADWLRYRLEPESWGAVVSHMAFSNHFIFHHLYRRGSVEPYARQYMAVLRSLKRGGSFYYAPGLPFIEMYLPQEKYIVTRQRVTGIEHGYACHVLRLL